MFSCYRTFNQTTLLQNISFLQNVSAQCLTCQFYVVGSLKVRGQILFLFYIWLHFLQTLSLGLLSTFPPCALFMMVNFHQQFSWFDNGSYVYRATCVMYFVITSVSSSRACESPCPPFPSLLGSSFLVCSLCVWPFLGFLFNRTVLILLLYTLSLPAVFSPVWGIFFCISVNCLATHSVGSAGSPASLWPSFLTARLVLGEVFWTPVLLMSVSYMQQPPNGICGCLVVHLLNCCPEFLKVWM